MYTKLPLVMGLFILMLILMSIIFRRMTTLCRYIQATYSLSALESQPHLLLDGTFYFYFSVHWLLFILHFISEHMQKDELSQKDLLV